MGIEQKIKNLKKGEQLKINVFAISDNELQYLKKVIKEKVIKPLQDTNCDDKLYKIAIDGGVVLGEANYILI